MESIGENFIFVSYSHKDEGVVVPLVEAMRAQGFGLWYDNDIPKGEGWLEAIVESIGKCAVFLVFMSPSVVESKYCKREIKHACRKDKSILVVHIEKTIMPDDLIFLLDETQHIFRYHYPTDKAFFDEICKTPCLQPCRGKPDNVIVPPQKPLPPNYEEFTDKIKKIFEKAVDGDAQSQYALAEFYMTLPNAVEAVRWYRKAAEKGEPYSKFHLGVCYENGQGVEQSSSEAIKWYKEAAKDGILPAIEALKRLL